MPGSEWSLVAGALLRVRHERRARSGVASRGVRA